MHGTHMGPGGVAIVWISGIRPAIASPAATFRSPGAQEDLYFSTRAPLILFSGVYDYRDWAIVNYVNLLGPPEYARWNEGNSPFRS